MFMYNIDSCNPQKELKMMIVFDRITLDMLSNRKFELILN